MMQEKPLNDNPEPDEIPGEDIVYTPDFVFLPKGRHTYRQEGPYLVCRGCELHHAIYIGMEKIMVGENEKGEPILKKRSELF
jgi:hypothetical protein